MSKGRKRIALAVDLFVTEYSQFIISGIRRACKEEGYELLIFTIGTINDLNLPYAYQHLAISAFITKNNVDGLIFVSGTQMHNLTKAELNSYIKTYKSIPIVNISSSFNGIPSVVVECEEAYKTIVKEITKNQECKTFGILGVDSNSTEVKDRLKNIKSSLVANGVSDSNIVCWKSDFEYSNTFALLEDYWAKYKKFKFDVVFALNDEMAAACMDFCKLHKIKIPKDTLIIGFDDSARASYASPSITSINHEAPEQGYQACKLIGKLMNGEEVPDITTIQATPIFRGSTQRNKYSIELKKNESCKVDLKRNTKVLYEDAVSNWYTEKNLFYQVTNYLTDIQTDVTLEQLQIRMNNDLKRFGVTACAIVVFNTPIEKNVPFDYFNLPHKAFVFSVFDYGTGVDTNGLESPMVFDPNKMMLPEGLLKYDHYGLFALSLFHNSLQYGYIIIRPGTFDISIYDLLCKILSTIIANVYSNSLASAARAQIEKKYDRLDFVASTDELTGLYNRRGLYDAGTSLLKHSEKIGQEGLVIYCDMDGLKKINDNFGHEAGDRAIIAESIILKGNFRSNDIISRIGGDEFAMVCPGMTVDAYEKIRKTIDEDCKHWTETSKSDYKLSLSMGYVKYPSPKGEYQLVRLLSEADEMLYTEKHKKHAAQL